MTYKPEPTDTSNVRLAPDIEELTEVLARHAHEVWARQRINDGWTVGDTRDDETKQTPCLVPYDELPDSEKVYDRNAALETLKVIQAMGYRLQPPPTVGAATVTHDGGDVVTAELLLGRLRLIETGARQTSSDGEVLHELPALLHVWHSRKDESPEWHCLPELYRHLGQRFLKLGEAPLAGEVAQAALELSITDDAGKSRFPWSNDVPLRQIRGLALARTGNTEDAQKILLKL